MTMTLAAVFAPLAFQTGHTGRLFTEFALTVAGGGAGVGLRRADADADDVLAAAAAQAAPRLVSTASCERVLDGHDAGYSAAAAAEPARCGGGRRRCIVAGRRGRMVVLFTSMPSELSPLEDRGFILGIGIAPEGATMDYHRRAMRSASRRSIATVPEVERATSSSSACPIVTRASSASSA